MEKHHTKQAPWRWFLEQAHTHRRGCRVRVRLAARLERSGEVRAAEAMGWRRDQLFVSSPERTSEGIHASTLRLLRRGGFRMVVFEDLTTRST